MKSDLTNYPPDTTCSYCGEDAPVRLIDNDGYAPDALICEGCFFDEVACWDDLPTAKLPKEEI